jgi:hypothetical protein
MLIRVGFVLRIEGAYQTAFNKTVYTVSRAALPASDKRRFEIVHGSWDAVDSRTMTMRTHSEMVEFMEKAESKDKRERKEAVEKGVLERCQLSSLTSFDSVWSALLDVPHQVSTLTEHIFNCIKGRYFSSFFCWTRLLF